MSGEYATSLYSELKFFGSVGAGGTVSFSPQIPVGANAGQFFVFYLSSDTVEVRNVFVSNEQRSLQRIVRVTGSSRSLEVWFFRPDYAALAQNPIMAELTGGSAGIFVPVDVQIAQFTIDGMDLDDPYSAAVTSVQAGVRYASLTVPDAIDDSFVIDVLALSSVVATPSTLFAGPEQTTYGLQTAGWGSLTISERRSYSDAENTMRWRFPDLLANTLHVAFIVKGKKRRNAAFQAFAQQTSVARTVLAEIEASMPLDIEDWTAETSAVIGLAGTTWSTASTYAHAFAGNLLVVTVMTTTVAVTAAASVTHNGVEMKRLSSVSRAGVGTVDIWYLRAPSPNGNVVISMGPLTLLVSTARTFTNVNQIFPFDATSFAGGTTFASSGVTTHPISAPGMKDVVILDAVMTAADTADPLALALDEGIVDYLSTLSARRVGAGHIVLTAGDEELRWNSFWLASWAHVHAILLPTATSRVYRTTFPTIITGGEDESGMMLAFDKAAINGEDLPAYPSIGSLIGASTGIGGFYYDSVTSQVYVRTYSEQSPITYAHVSLEFRLLLSNRVADFPGGNYYDPRLTGRLPSIKAEREEPLFGAVSYPDGDLEVENSDRIFDLFVGQWGWKNRKVRLYQGGEGLTRAEYRHALTMLIDDIQPGVKFISLKLRAQANSLQARIPQTTIGAYTGLQSGTVNTVVVDDHLSEFVPYVRGRLGYVPGKLVQDYSKIGLLFGFPYSYLFPSSVLASIDVVYASNRETGLLTALTPGIDFTASFLLAVSNTWPPDQFDILVSYTSSSRLIYAGNAIRELLLYAGVSRAEIDARSFEEFDARTQREVAFYQEDQVAVSDLINFIQKSAQASLYYSSEGTWSLREDLPTVRDYANLTRIGDENLRTLPETFFRPVTPFFEVIVQYDYKPYYDTFEEASRADLSVIGTHRTQESYFHRTCLLNATDAQVLADRIHAMQVSQPICLELEETGMTMLADGVGDRIRLTLARAPGSKTGSWADEIVQIVAYEKTLSPEEIMVRIDNMGGIGGVVKLAAPDYADLILTHLPAGYWRLGDKLSYAATVLTSQPTGYWRLDERTITDSVVDISPNARHGVFSSGVSSGPPITIERSALAFWIGGWQEIEVGTEPTLALGVTTQVSSALADGSRAIRLDGVTGGVTVPHSTVHRPLLADFSVELWVKWAGGTGNQYLIAKAIGQGGGGGTEKRSLFAFPVGGYWESAGGGPVADWGLFYNVSASVLTMDVGTASVSSAAGLLTDLQWHHVVVTCDRDGLAQFYVDGVAQGNGTIVASSGANLEAAVDLTFGHKNNANYFNGSIDEVALFIGHLLTAKEVGYHYAARLGTSAHTIAMVRDQVGTNHLAVVRGAVMGQTGLLTYDRDRALQLDGSSGYAHLAGADPLNGWEAVTLEGWVKGDGTWVNATKVFFNFGDQGHYLGLTSISTPHASLNIAGTQRAVSAASAVGVTETVHMAVTWRSGDYVRLYVNGVQVAVSGATYIGQLTAASTPNIGIGAFNTSSPAQYTAGFHDEMAVYPFQLTASEIAAHYRARLYGPPWDTVGDTIEGMDAERNQYAFAADDATGRVDVNDPTSKGRALAW
jgi:hypothetical protein